MDILCPQCDQAGPPRSDGNCSICGSPIAWSLSPPVKSKPAERIEQDELIRALRAHYEERRIPLPEEWCGQLKRLASAPEASNRLATVFFVDLRGYSRLANALSRERLAILRHTFDSMCQREIEIHGGFVIQFLGDAVFAAFGAPWSFERDTEHAAQCMLEIRSRIAEWGSFDGHPLAIRGGAATGVVQVAMKSEQGRSRPDLIGEAVVLANRLQGHAKTNELLVSEEMEELLSPTFDLVPRRKFTPKNLPGKRKPFSLQGRRAHPQPRRRELNVFVGRASELLALDQAMAAARRGDYAMVKVTGVPGIGKTRLVTEALKSFSRDGTTQSFLLNQDPRDQHLQLTPFVRLLRAVARRMQGSGNDVLDPAAELAALYSSDLGLEPLMRHSFGYLLQVPESVQLCRGIDGVSLKGQVFEALRHLVRQLGRLQPTVIVFDDSQWCDQLSARLISILSSDRPGGICLLAVGREGEDRERGEFSTSEADAPGAGSHEGVKLEPLSDEESLALLGALVKVDLLHPVVLKGLLRAAGGNPHYLIEQASMVIEKGVELPTRLPKTPQLVELLQSRTDRLPVARRQVLRRASILGTRFEQRRLSHFVSDIQRGEEEIVALLAGGFLADEGESLAFASNLLRETLLDGMDTAECRRLHRLAAQAVEDDASSLHGPRLVELSLHWIQSDEPERAAVHLKRATRVSHDLGEYAQAYELVAQGLRRSPEATPSDERPFLSWRALLHELAGRSARLMGQPDRALVHLEKWLELARLLENSVWGTNARSEIARTWLDQNRAPEARALFEQILAEESGPDAEHRLLGVRLRLGETLYHLGEFEKALALDLEIAATAGTLDAARTPHGEAWNNAGLAYWQLNRPAEADAAFGRAAMIYQAVGHVPGTARALNNRAIILQNQGNLAGAEAALRDALGIAESKGYLHLIAGAETNLGNISLLRGKYANARRHGERSLHFSKLIGHRHSESIALLILALAADGLGESPLAMRLAREAIDAARGTGDAIALHTALAESAWLAVVTDNMSEVMRYLEELPAELVGELSHLRSTTLSARQAITTGLSTDIFSVDAISRWSPDADLPSFLRRIETGIRLAAKGVARIDSAGLRRLREDRLIEADSSAL